MPNSLPNNLSYGTVNGRFLLAYADGVDSDLFPDGAPAKGTLFFTPSPANIKNVTATPAPVTILPASVMATLDSEGYLCGYGTTRGIRLLATDDLQGNPVDWTWLVEFRLTDADGASVTLQPFNFELPSGASVDLSVLGPVADSNGTPIIVGPPGSDFVIRGTIPTSDDLPETGNIDNQGYITEDDGHLWIWLEADEEWFDYGEFRGPGVAPGGSTNAILVKLSGTDYDTAWTNTIDGGNA
jgi:hypothetical protein